MPCVPIDGNHPVVKLEFDVVAVRLNVAQARRNRALLRPRRRSEKSRATAPARSPPTTMHTKADLFTGFFPFGPGAAMKSRHDIAPLGALHRRIQPMVSGQSQAKTRMRGMDGEGIQRWETSAVTDRLPWSVKNAFFALLTLAQKMDRPSCAGSQRSSLAGLGGASK